jgi:hypothetical protein
MMIARKLGFWVALGFSITLMAADLARAIEPQPRAIRDRPEEAGGLDLLDDLEAETAPVPEGEAAEEENLLYKLGSNLSGRARTRGQLFFEHPDTEGNPNMDRENAFGELLLELETFTGTKDWRLGLSGWVQGGTQTSTYGGVTHFIQDRQSKRRYAHLNEAYGQITGLDLGPGALDITAGTKIFKNGIATLYSPGDRYSAADFTDPLDTFTLGVWQLRTDYSIGNFTITTALLPVFQRAIEPHEDSRWLANSADFSFPGTDATIDVKTDVPDLSPNNFSYFGRLAGTVAGWDFFVAPYWGMSSAFITRGVVTDPMQLPTDVTKDIPHVFNLSAGFATVLFERYQFHGEMLYNYARDSEDDDYFTGVIGFTYKFDSLPGWMRSDFIEVTLEYAGEKILDLQTKDALDATGTLRFLKSSRDARLGRNNILIGITYQVNDDLSFQINTANQIERADHLLHAEGKYQIREDFFFILGLDEFSGEDPDTFYGRWERNDRVTGIFEYIF